VLRIAGLRRFEVEGRSMLQAYAPGDRLFVERVTYRLRRPRIGEVVVVRQPGADGRLDLKRIAASPGAEVQVAGAPDFLGHDEWYVLGDNLDESTDSRALGPVRTSDIVGRVWFRY
jgi:signal peptidase I